MNKDNIRKFEVVDAEILSTVNGGDWRCVVGTAGGAIFGGAFGGPWGALGVGTAANMFFCATPVS